MLEDAGIKLASVATDVLGVSGRQMLEALISGTRDPETLAELARGRLRAKLPALKRALVGNFKPHHALIVSHILAHLDYLDETIGTLSEELERRLAPFAHKAENLCTITAVAERVSQVILAELGPDMDRFASDRHAASWTAICPGNDEPASAARARPAGATRTCALLCSRPPTPPHAPRTPTCAPSTSRSNAVAGTRKRSPRSPTRS